MRILYFDLTIRFPSLRRFVQPYPEFSTTGTIFQRLKSDGAVSSLNAAIEATNLAKEDSSLGPVGVLLRTIRVYFPPFKLRGVFRIDT